MMDFFNHTKGECAASSDAALQKQLELVSLQVVRRLMKQHSCVQCCLTVEATAPAR